MTDLDEHLAYGSDEIADENGNHDLSRSPQPQPEAKDKNAQAEELKAREIIDACRRRDIEGLQALAESPGGFIRDELRQQACELCDGFSSPDYCFLRTKPIANDHTGPILLGLPVQFPGDDDEKVSGANHEAVRLTASEFVDDSWKGLTPHKEEEQVKLDVARAFVYYPNCKTLL